MRITAILSAFAAAAVTCFSSTASANQLHLKFDGLHFGTSSLIAKTNQGNVYAGALTWSEVSDPSSTFVTFCTEITKYVTSSAMYDVSPLEAAPTSTPAMGEYRAGLIQNLYNNFWHRALDSRTESAAFQLAIWEIVYEGSVESGASYTLDVTTGSGFRVTGGSANSSQDGFGMSAVQLANSWLSELMGSLGGSVGVTTLRALTSEDSQDQIILIPLPLPLMMAGLGLIAVPVLRRRFR